MRLCPRCHTHTGREDWRCPRCGAMILRPVAGGANDDMADDEELPQSVTITFTLRSGEAVEVRDFLDGPATEQAIREYGAALAKEIGKDTVRTFAYWYDDDFYMDAVLMDEVAAFSISADWGDEEEEED
jgi:hypothetical protein